MMESPFFPILWIFLLKDYVIMINLFFLIVITVVQEEELLLVFIEIEFWIGCFSVSTRRILLLSITINVMRWAECRLNILTIYFIQFFIFNFFALSIKKVVLLWHLNFIFFQLCRALVMFVNRECILQLRSGIWICNW